MAVPSLPAQGSPSWFSWAQGLHDEIATGRLADTTLRAAFGRPNITTETELLPLRIALASRSDARVNIPIIGDSQIEGQGVTNVAQRWVGRASATVRARLGLPKGGRGYISPVSTGENSYTYPAALVGGPSIQADKGAKSQGVPLGSAGQGVNYTLFGTSVDLMDVRYGGGGSYTVTVDGGAATTISTDGTFKDGYLTRVSLGASGAHTLAIRWASGAAAYHTGLIEYDGDESAGFTIHDCGHFGWTANQWNTNMGGGLPQQAIAALAPSAIGIALGHNEVANVSALRTPSQFQADLTTLITTVRAAITNPDPPFILIGYPAPGGYESTWPNYLAAMATVAAADSAVTFLDLSKAVPDHSTSSIYADSVHGNAKWHGMIGDLVASYLAPSL